MLDSPESASSEPSSENHFHESDGYMIDFGKTYELQKFRPDYRLLQAGYFIFLMGAQLSVLRLRKVDQPLLRKLRVFNTFSSSAV
jgi:hypothetical protein